MKKMAIAVEIGEIVNLEEYGVCDVVGKDVGKSNGKPVITLTVEDYGNGYTVDVDFDPSDLINMED